MPDESAAALSVITTPWLLVRKTVEGQQHDYELYDSGRARLAVVYRQDVPRQTTTGRKVLVRLGWATRTDTVWLQVVTGQRAQPLCLEFDGIERYDRARVRDRAGAVVGELVKARGVRKIHFDLEANGVVLATVDAEEWKGWDYRIEQQGTAVGRLAVAPPGLVSEVGATADDVLLEVEPSLDEPLRTLVKACAIGLNFCVSLERWD